MQSEDRGGADSDDPESPFFFLMEIFNDLPDCGKKECISDDLYPKTDVYLMEPCVWIERQYQRCHRKQCHVHIDQTSYEEECDAYAECCE